jgi:hypothetical protein
MCVQDACKRFSTGRLLVDSATYEGGADLLEHHQPSPENTGHHGPGSLLICGFGVQVPGGAPCLCIAPVEARRFEVG